MKFMIESSNETLTTHSGLGLVGLLYEKTDLQRKLNKSQTAGYHRRTAISNDAIVRTYIGLLSQGKNDFEHIAPYRKDDFFQHALGINKVPSPSAFVNVLTLWHKPKPILPPFLMKLHYL